MFIVRCSVHRRRLPPRGPRSSPRTVRPACAPRQNAKKFNQPLLGFDTSRVTSFYNMFGVRFSHALCSQFGQSRPLP